MTEETDKVTITVSTEEKEAESAEEKEAEHAIGISERAVALAGIVAAEAENQAAMRVEEAQEQISSEITAQNEERETWRVTLTEIQTQLQTLSSVASELVAQMISLRDQSIRPPDSTTVSPETKMDLPEKSEEEKPVPIQRQRKRVLL